MNNVNIIGYEDEKSKKYYRVLTRADIEKSIIDALTLIKSRYTETPTIKEFMADRDKLEAKVNNDLEQHIPVYNIYAMIRNKSLKKKLEVYENVIELYSYIYDCLLNHASSFGEKHTFNPTYKLDSMSKDTYSIQEILDTKINLDNLLESDFVNKFATYKFNRMNTNPNHEHTQEDYLEIEEKALKGQTQELNKKR